MNYTVKKLPIPLRANKGQKYDLRCRQIAKYFTCIGTWGKRLTKLFELVASRPIFINPIEILYQLIKVFLNRYIKFEHHLLET